MIDDVKDPYYFAERTAPPLGLLSIATYVSGHVQGIPIEVLDNAITSTDQIYKRIDGDIVGISVNLWNYEKSLSVAKIAKSKGALVVLGGHHASAIAQNILRNRPYVDLVIAGDGEHAFLELILGKPRESINNLVYRVGDKIISNNKINLALASLPIPKRHFVDLSPYFENYHKTIPNSKFKKYTTFYSHKGCKFKAKSGPCIFCGIAIDGYRMRHPAMAWKELTYLNETYGIDYVMDVGDSLTKSWVRRFSETMPPRTKIAYTGYVRSSDLDNEFASLLARINCHSIFLGIESGDDGCLQRARKGTTVKDNLLAAKILHDYDIKIRMGIVLGIPGETETSLFATIDHIEAILKNCSVEGIYTSLLVPMPGSPSFDMLLQSNGRRETLLKSDLFNPDELRNYWATQFTSVTFEQLARVAHQIQGMAMPICQ
jgi:radical SAM superfamily enzyme YgiQ (UPF0313 family)